MRRLSRVQRHVFIGFLAVGFGLTSGVPAFATGERAIHPHAQNHYARGYSPTPGRVGAEPTAGAGALPASVDLRASAPPVGDQGRVSSCVAWSIGYSLMGYYANKSNAVGAPYAPLYLYMRIVEPGGAPEAGTVTEDALTEASRGVDTQAHYTQGTINWQTPPTAAQIANATKYKISGWKRLWNGTKQGQPAQAAMQQALAAGSPVAIGMPVFSDFENLRGDVLYDTTTGRNLGGHMIAVYGYDAKGVFIRNSWGTSWGNHGDAHLSWSFIETNADSAYTVNGISGPKPPTTKAPVVSTITPSTVAPAGNVTVTVTGSGFTGATGVRVGTTAATGVTVVSDTSLRFVAPAQPAGTTAHVTVTGSLGTSATVATDQLSYVASSGPVLTSVSPKSGRSSSSTSVTLTGTGLAAVTKLTSGRRNIAFTRVSATKLTATMPARRAGTVVLRAVTASGQTSGGVNFTYLAN
jgi:hypothetical protein